MLPSFVFGGEAIEMEATNLGSNVSLNQAKGIIQDTITKMASGVNWVSREWLHGSIGDQG